MTAQLSFDALSLEPVNPRAHNAHEADLITLDRPVDWAPRTIDMPAELVALRAAYLEAAEARNTAYHRYYAALADHLNTGAPPALGKHFTAMRAYLEAEIARRREWGVPFEMHARELARVRNAMAALEQKGAA